jgi:hypothetical protein
MTRKLGFVAFKDASRERDQITYALPVRLARHPEFQVFNAIIQTIAIAMVNSFVLRQGTPEMALHN